jgi:hypothetical protein
VVDSELIHGRVCRQLGSVRDLPDDANENCSEYDSSHMVHMVLSALFRLLSSLP